MTLSKVGWADFPVSFRWSLGLVLAALALVFIVIPLMAQAPDQPVRVEQLVVGWSGMVALLGLAVQWGFHIRDRIANKELEAQREKTRKEREELIESYRKRDQERVDAALASLGDLKMDRRELDDFHREVSEIKSRVDGLNGRFDRFLEQRAA